MKLRLTGGGEKPTVQEDKGYVGRSKTSVDKTADVRDLIAALVGTGEVGGERSAAHYQALRGALGDDKAKKLYNYLMVYNQRPDMQGRSAEDRIKQLYEIPVSDQELGDLFKEVKSFGYGVVPGFRESANLTNQQLTGRMPMASASGRPTDAAQRIMLRVGR